MSAAPLAIVGAGMVSALGFNAPATWAAIRAKVSGLRCDSVHDPESGEPLTVGRVPLPHWWEGLGKYADLLAPAVLECLLAASRLDLAAASASAVPLLLTVSEHDRPFRQAGLDEYLFEELAHRLGPLHPHSRLLARGRCGGMEALEFAGSLLAAREASCCVVAGVDSHLHRRGLYEYIARRRVVTPTNSNGFLPGEASAAVLVTSAAAGRDELRVLGTAGASEAAIIESDEPLRGEGLSNAVRSAMNAAGVTMLDVDYRLTDLNGEHYKFKESMLMISKNLRKPPRGQPMPEGAHHMELWHPIEYLGDIGAAILPCLLGLGLEAGRGGWAPGPLALCHVGDDGGARAAAILRFSSQTRSGSFMGRHVHER